MTGVTRQTKTVRLDSSLMQCEFQRKLAKPLSVDRLDAKPVPLSEDLLDQLRWTVSQTSEPRPRALPTTAPM